MNFLSKEASLEESINKMKAVLTEAGCETTLSHEKHPLKYCYSVNLSSVEAPNHIYANGKGIVSNASLASAYGEYIERLQTNNFFIDFHLPQRKYFPDEVKFSLDGDYLNTELRSLYDPEGELTLEELVDFNSDTMDQIVALPFVKQSTNDKVYFPINILSNLYLSNGLATGNTPQEAQVQALSEIFERYVKTEIIRNGYSLPKFPEEIVQSFDRLHSDIQDLRKLGYVVEVLDASLGGKYPVTAISLINPTDSSLFVSFGAHPILEVSLERTMTELMQGRGLDNLTGFEVPTFNMTFVSSSYNLESHFVSSEGKLGFGLLSTKNDFPYTAWTYQGEGCEAEYSYLTGILADMDKDIYLREYNYLGFYSCQMVVPGISEVYPIDDLIYGNRNGGKFIRDLVLNFKNHDPEEILEQLEHLDDMQDVARYIGVIFTNTFTIQDFKAQLYIALGESEEAIAALEGGTHKLGRVLAELIRMDSAGLDLANYEEALCNVFTKEKVEQALSIIKGEVDLIETDLHQDYQNMLKMYDRLEQAKQVQFPTK